MFSISTSVFQLKQVYGEGSVHHNPPYLHLEIHCSEPCCSAAYMFAIWLPPPEWDGDVVVEMWLTVQAPLLIHEIGQKVSWTMFKHMFKLCLNMLHFHLSHSFYSWFLAFLILLVVLLLCIYYLWNASWNAVESWNRGICGMLHLNDA